MNYYILKGVLMNGAGFPAEVGLKQRVFEAVAYPGFANSTYDVIGVEFGLGMMELNDEAVHDESTIAKIQLWNLNERKRFFFNYMNFLSGSRFAIITWKPPSKKEDMEFTDLVKTLDRCKNNTNQANVGVIALVSDHDWMDIVCNLEDKTRSRFTVVENLEELVFSIVKSCIEMKRHYFILPIESIDEITAVEPIINPCSNHPGTMSSNLVPFLKRNGYDVSGGNIVEIEKENYSYRFDLNTLTLHVACTSCSKCKSILCRSSQRRENSFKRICIIWESPIKKGYASEDTGLSESDLYALSVLYSIEHETLPKSIKDQFPRPATSICR